MMKIINRFSNEISLLLSITILVCLFSTYDTFGLVALSKRYKISSIHFLLMGFFLQRGLDYLLSWCTSTNNELERKVG